MSVAISSFHCRSLSASNGRHGEESWFKSLFVRKVDPRKDAHSHLLAKKEESNLYKIQCVYYMKPNLCLGLLCFVVSVLPVPGTAIY